VKHVFLVGDSAYSGLGIVSCHPSLRGSMTDRYGGLCEVGVPAKTVIAICSLCTGLPASCLFYVLWQLPQWRK
jgi:hypothetical protein